jgi:membrane-bound metal-dependent hydrolase YbcI (DUF457 family)
MKGVAPRMSLGAFAAAQVAVDLEPGYRLLTGTYPVHGWSHSLLGGAALGTGAALACLPLVRLLNRRLAREPGGAALFRRPSAASALLGGLAGGLSHVALDALVHAEVGLLWPWRARLPGLDVVPDAAMAWGCVLAAVAGIALVLRGSGGERRGARPRPGS